MGEIADAVLAGHFCQHCGEYLGGGDGIPRSCVGCGGDAVNPLKRAPRSGPLRHQAKITCPHCGRQVKKVGLGQHMLDVHPELWTKGSEE